MRNLNLFALATLVTVGLCRCNNNSNAGLTSIKEQKIEPKYQLCEYYPGTDIIRSKFFVKELKPECDGNWGKRSCYGDVLEGPVFTFNEEGILISHAYYDDGLLTGLAEVYDDAGYILERSFWIPENDNTTTTLWTEYYDYHQNSRLKSITHFDAKGRIQGSVVIFDSLGNWSSTENYCNGDLIEFKVNQCE